MNKSKLMCLPLEIEIIDTKAIHVVQNIRHNLEKMKQWQFSFVLPSGMA